MKKLLADYCSLHAMHSIPVSLAYLLLYILMGGTGVIDLYSDMQSFFFTLYICLFVAYASAGSLLEELERNQQVSATSCLLRITIFHLSLAILFASMMHRLQAGMQLTTDMPLEVLPFFLSALLFGVHSYKKLLSGEVNEAGSTIFSPQLAFFVGFCFLYFFLARFAMVQAVSTLGLVFLLARTFQDLDASKLEESLAV